MLTAFPAVAKKSVDADLNVRIHRLVTFDFLPNNQIFSYAVAHFLVWWFNQEFHPHPSLGSPQTVSHLTLSMHKTKETFTSGTLDAWNDSSHELISYKLDFSVRQRAVRMPGRVTGRVVRQSGCSIWHHSTNLHLCSGFSPLCISLSTPLFVHDLLFSPHVRS